MDGPAMTDLTPAIREKLMKVSVATLATALFKRGLRNQTHSPRERRPAG